jgi:glutamyl-tRNA reductase
MHHVFFCGLDYKSQPLAARERLAAPASCLEHALRHLSRLPALSEAAILSTCNRFEVYAVTSDLPEGSKQVLEFFAKVQAVKDHEALKPTLLFDEQAVEHLCRVASGLESMVLGEGQIMSQVKTAYRSALDASCAGPILKRLFQLALHCGKRVRGETSIGTGAVSTGAAAIELARRKLGSLQDKSILVVGAGRAGQMCVKHLLSLFDRSHIQVINHSAERLEQMRELDKQGLLDLSMPFELRHELAAGADLVIVATAADSFVLRADKLEQLGSAAKVIIDMSVPRNVDPAVGTNSKTQLYTIDDLSSIVETNLKERSALCWQAEQIIAGVIGRRWIPWVVQRHAQPTACCAC